MFRWSTSIAAAAFSLGVAFSPVAKAQDIDAIMALPAGTLAFTIHFAADEGGFYKREGLNVTTRMLVGVAAFNAVISGSADFTLGTGPVFLRAAAQGQRMLAIANYADRPAIEMVLRKDVYEQLKITSDMPLAERAKRLKGLTIGIQGVASITHAYERVIVSRGGLDPENDVRVAPMDPPAMQAAMESKAIDGYLMSAPITTQPVLKGTAVMFFNAATDMPDMVPFAYGLVMTMPQVCQTSREKCARMARALAKVAMHIQEKPNEVYETVVRKRFPQTDPALLAAAWDATVKAHARDIRVTVAQLENSQKLSLDARLLDPKDALKSYDGLFTDEFIR